MSAPSPASRVRPQPLLCVRDVEASSRWCQRLLGDPDDDTVVRVSPDGSAGGA